MSSDSYASDDGEYNEEELIEDSDGPSSENDNNSEEEADESSDNETDNISVDDIAQNGGWMDVGGNDSDLSTSDEEVAPCKTDIKTNLNTSRDSNHQKWVNSLAKIVRTSKPKGKKSVILARSKKASQLSTEKVKPGDGPGFEIEGEIKKKEEDVKPDTDVKPDVEILNIKRRKRELLAEGIVKPSILDRERERALSKIATRGVVQLFNAVRQQQKDISNKLSEVGGSVRKEEKVLKSFDKRAFLDVLMGNAKSERVEDLVPKTELKLKTKEEPVSSTWSVLQDNFMMGSNLKDWDKSREIKLSQDFDDDNDDDEVQIN